MISYLSLKRKKPVMDEHNIPNRTQPVQFVITLSPSKPQNFISNNNSIRGVKINAIPSAEIHPTATTINHFCLSFISQFNTVTSIIVVTQV